MKHETFMKAALNSNKMRETTNCYYPKPDLTAVPLNQRPSQHGRRTVFNIHNQQSQTNKQAIRSKIQRNYVGTRPYKYSK